MSAATLTLEIFTEELPPKALEDLGDAFAESIANGLRDRGFLQAASIKTGYATPRRLAVKLTHVLAVSPDKPFTQRLMPANVALDASGKPTMALRKRLDALGRGDLADRYTNGVELDGRGSAEPGEDRLTRESDGRTEAIFLHSIAKGSPLRTGLQSALDVAIATLPIPKVMTYQGADGADVKFVRPVHRLLALHGGAVVPVTAFGLDAGRTSGGHRFLGRRDIDIATAEAYEETLAAEGKVIASYPERRARLGAALAQAAEGATVIMPDALLDEVNSLVEWPAVYPGTFDPAYLAVPQECLILTMQKNQKYFALADDRGKLANRFLLVSNIETAGPSAIIEGNERVLRARLADAKFFYDQDRKQPLEARVPKLASVVFHNQLGSQLDRVVRIERLSGDIADASGADRTATQRAARLAKADLVTDMVGEFPELQGLMGRYYAEHDGEAPLVAHAIEQHYWPRFAGDALPESPAAQALALADKMETLAGLFGIGEQPTGDKDPYGSRRQAIGVIRILIERKLALPLHQLVNYAFAAFADVSAVHGAHSEVETFIFERLRGYLRDLGNSTNQVEAVLCLRPPRLDIVPALLDAVRSFSALPEAESLAAANKRIVNILRKAEGQISVAIDRELLAAGAEYDLYTMFDQLAPAVEAHRANGDYAGMLLALAAAKPAVDRFFDDVMVMADDPAVRANRLALLEVVRATMTRVADISKLAV